MEIHLSRLVVLVLLAGIAAVYDVTARTIPNWLTASGLVLGLALAALVGPAEAGYRALAAVVTLVVGLPLFRLGILGGGDVKLLVAVAGLVGFERLPTAVFLACVTGALIAIAEVIRRGFLLPLVLDARDVALYYLSAGRHGRRVPAARGTRLTVPYAVAIGVGALVAWWG